MKKLFLFLITLVIFASCTNNIEEIKDPEKKTTVYLQQLPKDTVAISIDEDKLYVFNEDNTVEYKVTNIDKGNYVIVHNGILIILIFAIIVFGFILLVQLLD